MIRVVTDLTKYELDIRAVINMFYRDKSVVFADNQDECKDDWRLTIEQKHKTMVTRLVVTDNSYESVHNLKLDEDFLLDDKYDEQPFAKELIYSREVKNKIKSTIYDVFAQHTGYKSKWGTLTGVRPAKLAFLMKKNGMDNEGCIRTLKEEYLCSEEKARLITQIAWHEYDKVKEYVHADNYSLYIGIPFCPTTCLYCSFASNPVAGNQKAVKEYLEALYKEMELTAASIRYKKLVSVYIGGGTPTALNCEEIEDLLYKIKTEFNLNQIIEYTVEAGRPDSITKEKLLVLKKYGVTRISINPQVMDDEVLSVIGRRHSVDDVIEKYNLARELGFDNINMDLIMGLPRQTVSIADDTLSKIIKLNPESVTVHTLTLKKNSKLTHYLEAYSDMMDDNVEIMVNAARKALTHREYIPYYLYRQKNITSHLENVGYSKAGYECIYNILMMEEMQTIVACGAGTISKKVNNPMLLFEGETGVLPRIERHDNPKNLKDYIDKIDYITDKKIRFLKRDGACYGNNDK